MLKVKIKALKRAVHDDLIMEYENPILHACDIVLGTEFISINGEMPEGFCASAWESVGPYAKRLANGEENFLFIRKFYSHIYLNLY